MATYIANGHYFKTFEEATDYAASIGMRISNTESRRGVHILDLHSNEEWERYEADLQRHEEYMKAREPKDKNSPEYREWSMAYSCDAPNKPGYYRANND